MYICNVIKNKETMTTIITILQANELIDNVLSVKDLQNVLFNIESRKVLNDFCNKEFESLINLYASKEICTNDIYNSLDELKFKLNN
jgi:hypothetical protein